MYGLEQLMSTVSVVPPESTGAGIASHAHAACMVVHYHSMCNSGGIGLLYMSTYTRLFSSSGAAGDVSPSMAIAPW